MCSVNTGGERVSFPHVALLGPQTFFHVNEWVIIRPVIQGASGPITLGDCSPVSAGDVR